MVRGSDMAQDFHHGDRVRLSREPGMPWLTEDDRDYTGEVVGEDAGWPVVQLEEPVALHGVTHARFVVEPAHMEHEEGSGTIASERAPDEQTPRWQRAGRPYLLTRDELIAELARRSFPIGEPQLRDWVSRGILPKPTRRIPPLAERRVARALYPAYLIPALEELLKASHQRATIAEIKGRAPAIIARWREQIGAGQPRDAVFNASVATATASAPAATLSGGGTIPAPTGSGTGLTFTPAPATVGTSAQLGGVMVGQKPLVHPRLLSDMQRSMWEYARRFAEANGAEVNVVELTVHTADGQTLSTTIPQAGPPRPRRRSRGNRGD